MNKERRKLKLKKFNWHPITVMIIAIIAIVLLSGILTVFDFQTTYSVVDTNTNELEPVLVSVENLMSFEGLKFIISNATRNFISFLPLSMLLITMIGLGVAEGTGFINTLVKRHFSKVNRVHFTFFLLLIAIFSTVINEVGYVFLIPLAAVIYHQLKRNPITGIVTAFVGVSFGYGVTLFTGSTEVALIQYTQAAANLIDPAYHVSLTSNLYIIIALTIIFSIIGTYVIEKFIAPKIGKYKAKDDLSITQQLEIITEDEEEQKKLEETKRTKTGLQYALVTGIIGIIVFIYMIVPSLPFSGLLLDMNETAYINQLFGANAYFQDGFTYMLSIIFLLMGIAYGIGAKAIKNDKTIIDAATDSVIFKNIGRLILYIFIASQLIAIFRETNIGTVLTGMLANFLNDLNITGIPLIIVTIVIMAISNIFVTTPAAKWIIFSPVVVPMLMQSNISPGFSQMLLRASDSITNGITPLLAFFVIYIGYLNIYNLNKNEPIGFKQAIGYVMPYFIMMTLAWILLIVGWYIIGLPIGPDVYPTI